MFSISLLSQPDSSEPKKTTPADELPKGTLAAR